MGDLADVALVGTAGVRTRRALEAGVFDLRKCLVE